MEIRIRTLTWTVVISIFVIFGGMGTALLFSFHTFIGLFLYLLGGIFTFILLNLEYEWVKVK